MYSQGRPCRFTSLEIVLSSSLSSSRNPLSQRDLFKVIPNGGKGDCGPASLWHLIYGGKPTSRDLREMRNQAVDEVKRHIDQSFWKVCKQQQATPDRNVPRVELPLSSNPRVHGTPLVFPFV